jgi:hypothetical protein
MTLEEFLKYIDLRIRRYGDFRVVAIQRPPGKSRRANKIEILPVTDVFPDDEGKDIILLICDEENCPNPTEISITLKELNTKLKSLVKGRKKYSVECSSRKPDGGWRLDLPVYSYGMNETEQLFAVLIM